MRSPVLSPRQFDWTLLAFATTLAAHLLWLPIWFGATLTAILIARWLQRRAYARAWPGWIKFPVLIVVLILVVIAFGNAALRQAGPTAALLSLATLKLIESERRRDGLLVLTVSLFLVSVLFLFVDGIGITLYMVVPTLLIFFALNEVNAPPGTRGGLSSELGSLGRELLMLVAVVLPLTAFLFASLPRLGTPLWGSRDLQRQARTGLSDEMAPGTMTELLTDDTPVMRVTFPERTPPNNAMYWRGPVLWRFDGVTWRTNSLSGPGQIEGRVRGPQTGASGDLRYRVMLEPTDRNGLYTLDLATGFPAQSSRTVEGAVLRDQPVSSLFPYEAWAAINTPIPVLAVPNMQRRWGLELPEGLNPRTAALAQGWRAEVGDDPIALADRAMRHIRGENFGYTMSPPPLVGAHRMDEFLFETQLGFCEHYAAAFVVLMRSAGVPARVVTGFLGGAFNPIGKYHLIRKSDAHAWAEILVEGRGWTRYDPTAAIAPERIDLSGRDFASQATGGNYVWLRGVRERFDAAQAWWNETIVRFDRFSQRAFFAKLGVDADDWHDVAAWMGGGVLFFGLLTAGVLYLQRRRVPVDVPKQLYRSFLKSLAKRGISSSAQEGASDLGKRAALALPDLAQPILAVVHAYQEARYGPPAADAIKRLQQALDAFRKAVSVGRV